MMQKKNNSSAHRVGLGLATALSSALFCFAAMPEAEAQTWTEKLDGVEYTTIDRVHAVRIDLSLVGVSIWPSVSDKGEPMTPKSWAQKRGLEVAINANFYGMENFSPCSFAICNGTNWGSAENPATYAQMGFSKDNRLKWLEESSTEKQTSWMHNVVSGSPEIIVNGTVVPNLEAGAACKDLGHCAHKRSRSGMGVDKNQKYLYLVVSKGDGTSMGNTVSEFAQTMQKLGVWYGINLDGGGSSGLYVNGETYGPNVSSRSVAVNLGFNVNAKPSYVCKNAEVDNPSTSFYDIPAGHWGLAAAEALAERGITLGCGTSAYGHPMFCPDCGTTRVQAAVFIARALNLKDTPPSTPSFQDATTDNLSAEEYAAIESLLKHGIVSPGTNFRPKDILTRAETATMISKAYITDTVSYKNAPTPTFSDVSKSSWEYPYVEAMARNCYMSGTGDNLFQPKKNTTRIEFATALARAAKWFTFSCAFEKQCQISGEKSCKGNNVQVCTAYELVDTGACAEGTTCTNGACVSTAECNTSDASVCDGNAVQACVDGKWTTTACAQACENGKCVECTSDTLTTCQGNTVALCVNGKLEYNICGADEICEDGQCRATAVCVADETKCHGNEIYKCSNGQGWFSVMDCALTSKVCQNGACVDPKPECADDFTSVCESENSIKMCFEGQWAVVDCNDNEKCQNGQCVVSGNSTDNGDNPDNDNTTGDNPDNDDTTGDNPDNDNTTGDDDVVSTPESSCAHSPRSGYPVPWILALMGCLSGLALRRSRKQDNL